MKKVIHAGCLVLGMMTWAYAEVQHPYAQVQIGAIENPGAVFGARAGAQRGPWDLSAGYWTTRDARLAQEGLLSNSLDLNVFDLTLYRVFPAGEKVSMKIGGGVGYVIPNLSGPDHADNDYCLLPGIGADYRVNAAWSVGVLVQAFIFNTNTRRTTYGSHVETLSNGTDVEVLDTFHDYNSVNFNAIVTTVGVKYHF